MNGGSVRLFSSTLTGNVANFPATSETFGTDLFTTGHPRLVATTCDHSAVLTGDLPPASWGVCALD